MLTQAQADRLITMAKEAERDTPLQWKTAKAENEVLVSVEEKGIMFVLFMKRNPFEIRLHLRTKDRDVGLMRVDNHRYHANPDGSEIREKAHLHKYKEGDGLAWAEAIDWYDLENPNTTLERFLALINARFPMGIQLEMF